jgi:hypothetical protein
LVASGVVQPPSSPAARPHASTPPGRQGDGGAAAVDDARAGDGAPEPAAASAEAGLDQAGAAADGASERDAVAGLRPPAALPALDGALPTAGLCAAAAAAVCPAAEEVREVDSSASSAFQLSRLASSCGTSPACTAGSSSPSTCVGQHRE